jgi:hypothetical protein
MVETAGVPGGLAADLIPLVEAQRLLPADASGCKPSLRWISTEARRLGCYRKVGKRCGILRRAWGAFVCGMPWPEQSASEQDRILVEALALSGQKTALNEFAKRRVAERPEQSWVYFIRVTSRVKIGVATNPASRMMEMQVGCPWPMTIVGMVPGSYPLESELHKRFKVHRLDGEWFRYAPEIKQFVREHGL